MLAEVSDKQESEREGDDKGADKGVCDHGMGCFRNNREGDWSFGRRG